jgi:large-conductance mechanosensitive channel
MILIRFALISLIIYLIVRSFTKYRKAEQSSVHKSEQGEDGKINSKGVSKKIGEYIDYEDIDK